MKYMGWSWEQLMETPPHVVEAVVEVMNEAAEEMDRIRGG